MANYLPEAGGWISEFIHFLSLLVECEMQTISSSIWTRVFCVYDYHYTVAHPYSCMTIYIYIYIYKCVGVILLFCADYWVNENQVTSLYIFCLSVSYGNSNKNYDLVILSSLIAATIQISFIYFFIPIIKTTTRDIITVRFVYLVEIGAYLMKDKYN